MDDTLGTHPKARAAGMAAMGVWVLCGSWSSQQLTDGHVPEWFVRSLPNGKRHAARLVDAGLWVETDDGWLFHDWAESNPTRAEVETQRKKTATRVADWRARNSVTANQRNGVTNSVSNAAPTRPDP